MIEAYYVIKCLMHDADNWNNANAPMIYHYYAYEKDTYISWSPFAEDARKFKNISEIRRFITRGLKCDYNNLDINSWVFERIFTVPHSDIITSSHTMALLRSVK